MNKATPIMVAKREGTLEPFEIAKLRRSLIAAMKACNRNPRFAEALARAVELHLRGWNEPSPPNTGYIYRCLRTALTETGMGQVAQTLSVHRAQRAVRRAKLSVYDTQKSRFDLAPWRKSAIAETLAGRHDLTHATARFLAGEIERRVLALEYNTVSKPLLRELVRNELLAWGLTEAVMDVAPAAYDTEAVPDRAPSIGD